MCGIIGVSRKEKNAIGDIYDGLLMLQHRGQDSSGIVTFNGKNFREKRGFGLVRDAFSSIPETPKRRSSSDTTSPTLAFLYASNTIE